MSGSDRNSPCPCGSGRKFKRCCGAPQAAPPTAARFTQAERESALAKLMSFCARPEFAEDFEAAGQMFDEASGDRPWDDSPPGSPGDDDQTVEVELPLWFATAWPVHEQATPLDLLLSRRGWTLSTGEREFLRRLAAAELRAYEVVHVEPGAGFEAIDLWSNDRVRVRERLGSTQLVVWDLLACRLMNAGGDLVIEGSALKIPRLDKEPFLRALKRAVEDYVADAPGRTPEAFFRCRAPLFVRMFLDRSVKARGLPEIRTGDGEPLVLAKAVFSVHDEAAVRAALERHPAIDAGEDGRTFTLLREEDPEEGARVLGTFTLRGDRLQLEALSERRVKEGRALLESIAGAAVTHRATALQSVASALASRDRTAPAKPDDVGIPREEQARLLTTFYERHYRKWLDAPVPALEGRTPRQAARSRSLRVRNAVAELLKGIEQQAEHERREKGTSFDPAWMWSELGLPRPSAGVGRPPPSSRR